MDMDTILFWRSILSLDSSILLFPDDFDLTVQLGTFFEEVRPSVGERMLESLRARDRSADPVGLGARLCDDLAGAFGRDDIALTVTASEHDSPSLDLGARSVTLILIGIAAGLVAAGGQKGVGAVVVIVVAVLLSVLLLESARR